MAHAELLGKPIAEKVVGIDLEVPPESPAKIVDGKYASYVVVPCPPAGPSEKEIRAALDALFPSLRR